MTASYLQRSHQDVAGCICRRRFLYQKEGGGVMRTGFAVNITNNITPPCCLYVSAHLNTSVSHFIKQRHASRLYIPSCSPKTWDGCDVVFNLRCWAPQKRFFYSTAIRMLCRQARYTDGRSNMVSFWIRLRKAWLKCQSFIKKEL